MKKLTLVFICSNILLMMIFSPATAQQKDTVYVTSSEIKKMIDDKYYVRVPSSDLEQRLQDKVTGVVNNKFSFIYGLIGVISFLIGGILLFNLRSVVGSRIDKELKEIHIPPLTKKIDESIRDTKERVDDIKEMVKNKMNDLDKDLVVAIENYFFKNFQKTMDNALAQLKQEQEKAIQVQQEFTAKGAEVTKIFNEMRFDKLRANVESRQDLQKTYDGFKDLLAQADKNKDADMISRVLNELSYVAFYLKKDAEYEKLIDSYSEWPDVTLNEASFVNAALGQMYDYQATGSSVMREKTLRYISKALKKTDDYGEALGLKLEVFMTDYSLATEAAKKDLAINEAEKVVDFINSKNIAAYETVARLRRVQASTAKSAYIDLLYQVFPDKMKQMETIADTYNPRPVTT